MSLEATRRRRTAGTGLLLACAVLVGACTASSPSAPVPGSGTAPVASGTGEWAQDDAAIRREQQASLDAWNAGSLDGHLALYDPAVTMMTRNGPTTGVDPIREAFTKAFFVNGKPKQSLRMESLALRQLTEGAALMTGRFILFGGGEPERTGWFTLVWVRTPQGWRAVHDHSS